MILDIQKIFAINNNGCKFSIKFHKKKLINFQEEKALEQLQQVQKDLTEQARLDREAARERANNHKQLENSFK